MPSGSRGIPHHHPRETRRMRILYVLNGFDRGGAEHGLLTLVENGAFEDHDLRVLALCRGRGDLADKIGARLGKRVQFVTNGDTLTLWACSAGFFSILRTAFAFRPQKMVLSLKQANVVGRTAAILMPRLTCVAFEHIAEYRARRFQGLYGPLLHLLSRRVDEVWADCEETLDETGRYFVPRDRARHVIPLFVAESHGPFKTDYALGPRLRLAAAGRLIARKNVPLMVAAVDGSASGRRRCDARRLRRGPREAGHREAGRGAGHSGSCVPARLPRRLGKTGDGSGHLPQPLRGGGFLHRRGRSDARGFAGDRRRRWRRPRLRSRRPEHGEAFCTNGGDRVYRDSPSC